MKESRHDPLSRRRFLELTAALGAAAAATNPSAATGPRSETVEDSTHPVYKYRIGFGAWINDMRNEPLPLQNWPAPQFDDATIEGAVRAMEVMRDAGFEYLDAFGLWATNDYPPDIVSAFENKDRRRRLSRLFREADKRGIGVILPLGLLTWGFDRIIAEDPEVRGSDAEGKPHAHAMCGAKEKTWRYIEKLIDTAMAQFEFAGVHMESADLGWCMCPQCGGQYGAVGYNCRVNIRAADYIKAKWPDKLVYAIPINWVPWRLAENGLQQQFSRPEFDEVVALSKHIDVFMDQGHRGNYTPAEWIPELCCEYGTSGGLWVYHSVRMHRLSYFIPYPMRACRLIKRDHDRGARACLYYQGPMINPAVEVNTAVAGRILRDVNRDPRGVLEEVVEQLYRPRNAASLQKVCDVFARVEEGYFGRWNPDAIEEAHKLDLPGEFSGWGLFGEEPEIPAHLCEPFLDKAGRAAYKDELIACLKDLEDIKPDLAETERTSRVVEALLLTVQFLKVYIAYNR